MKSALLLMALLLSSGCMSKSRQLSPDLQSIGVFLGGDFPVMKATQEDVSRLHDFSDGQKEELRDILSQGSDVYLVLGPDWETRATDAQGTEIVLQRVHMVLVLREARVLKSMSGEQYRPIQPPEPTSARASRDHSRLI